MTAAPLAKSFATQLADLRTAVVTEWRAESPEAGFVEWAISRSDTHLGVALPSLDAHTFALQRWSEAPVLASVGYRLSTPGRKPEFVDAWRAGIQRLMARDVVPVDRNSFFFRPVELLGLVVGAQAVSAEDGQPLDWLHDTLATHRHRLPHTTPWASTFAALAEAQAGSALPDTQAVVATTQLDVALLLWLTLACADVAQAVTTPDMATLQARLLEMAALDQPSLHGLAEQGVYLIGLHRAVLATVGTLETYPGSATDLVVSLCQRFPLLTRELTNRHAQRPPLNMSDEYDVQDLLRAVLRLHFSDVRSEEWNPSYGAVQSRSDLFLKPERIVIETKMTRPSLGQRELVQQLIVDKAQYRTHAGCRTLVCFVYDPGHRLANPDAIEKDLSDDAGDLRTVVVVSPHGL